MEENKLAEKREMGGKVQVTIPEPHYSQVKKFEQENAFASTAQAVSFLVAQGLKTLTGK